VYFKSAVLGAVNDVKTIGSTLEKLRKMKFAGLENSGRKINRASTGPDPASVEFSTISQILVQ